MRKRESFNSRWGFILACIGSAVGMGNIWMFPTRVSLYGGGAFLIPYFIFVILIGFTGVISEMSFGRATRSGPIDAFGIACESRGHRKAGEALGWIPVLGALAMAIGYTVVMGWILKYTIGTFTGAVLAPADIDGFAGAFGSMASSFGNNFWQTAALVICMIILMFGVGSGIEKANKIMMPVFFVLFIILGIYVAFQPGAVDGYHYIFRVDPKALSDPVTWIFALGQAFFSLSVAGNGTLIYGSYLPDTEVFHNLPLSVISIIFLYFLIFSIFWLWTYKTNLTHQKLEQEKDEKYKAELLIAAKKAEAANEAKTEFLQRMSHDIRTPINGICGLVNMADHYADDMEKQTEYRTKVKEASNLLLELVNDVLDMSKLESGEIVLEEIPFNLSSIYREVFVVIEQVAAEQNLQIVWEKKEITHRDLIGSPRYVKRVMMNILSNAMKYNRENGHIYISCIEIPSGQPETTTMEFVCRDTGIGMAEEFQKHIFEPFAQEHAGSRTKFAGTGLGMPISKKLIEKMGGTITFESAEGIGTTFVIRVPFKIDLDVDIREEQADVSEKSIKGLHILLAEDNELNMEIAEFVLQNEGAEVSKAWNGEETVELFRKSESGEFDAILMDIMMPVMNGYEATKMIRSLDREDAKVIPIIAMTANAFTEDRLRAKEAGMNEHIAKPFDVKLLVKIIHKLVH